MIMSDSNNNIAELPDGSGDVVAHYEYSPFGSLTKTTAAYAASNPFRFSSEYFDEETGLVYYNYRYYNPELGRWISRDPIEEQGGYNLYGMIGNNPLYGWDELGQGLHEWWCKIRDLLGLGKDITDAADDVKNAKDHIDNAKTIIDKNASPGDKARAATEEIADAAERAGRSHEAKSSRAGGEKAGRDLDKITEIQNSEKPYAGSRRYMEKLLK